jgi:hypothetical protein
MPRVGFEPTTPVFERAKTVHNLDGGVTVIGLHILHKHENTDPSHTSNVRCLPVSPVTPRLFFVSQILTSSFLQEKEGGRKVARVGVRVWEKYSRTTHLADDAQLQEIHNLRKGGQSSNSLNVTTPYHSFLSSGFISF